MNLYYELQKEHIKSLKDKNMKQCLIIETKINDETKIGKTFSKYLKLKREIEINKNYEVAKNLLTELINIEDDIINNITSKLELLDSLINLADTVDDAETIKDASLKIITEYNKNIDDKEQAKYNNKVKSIIIRLISLWLYHPYYKFEKDKDSKELLEKYALILDINEKILKDFYNRLEIEQETNKPKEYYQAVYINNRLRSLELTLKELENNENYKDKLTFLKRFSWLNVEEIKEKIEECQKVLLNIKSDNSYVKYTHQEIRIKKIIQNNNEWKTINKLLWEEVKREEKKFEILKQNVSRKDLVNNTEINNIDSNSRDFSPVLLALRKLKQECYLREDWSSVRWALVNYIPMVDYIEGFSPKARLEYVKFTIEHPDLGYQGEKNNCLRYLNEIDTYLSRMLEKYDILNNTKEKSSSIDSLNDGSLDNRKIENLREYINESYFLRAKLIGQEINEEYKEKSRLAKWSKEKNIHVEEEITLDIKGIKETTTVKRIRGKDSEKSKGIDKLKLQAVQAELDSLIGLNEIKRQIRELTDVAELNIVRKRVLKEEFPNLISTNHLVFLGPPGTGKTTVARILGSTFNALGITSKDLVIEVSASDLVAGYLGQTRLKTSTVIKSALGGILFIDEAYSLNQRKNSENVDYGSEALTEILIAAENNRDNLVIILAGYENEMQSLLDSNPGLNSRFPNIIRFSNYTKEELLEIFNLQTLNSGFKLSDESQEKILKTIESMLHLSDKNFGNARAIRELLLKTIRNQSSRLTIKGIENISPEELTIILPEDIKSHVSASKLKTEHSNLRITGNSSRVGHLGEINKEEFKLAMAKLDKLIGQKNLKREITEISSIIQLNTLRNQVNDQSNHMVFLGPPGTGKTTVARIIGDVYCSIGAIPSDRVVEVNVSDLTADYLGQTTTKTNKIIDAAKGGILFIDEAYSLLNNIFGKEALETLLIRAENERKELIIILAGYKNEMLTLLDSNPGLSSRFPNHIQFESFTHNELIEIFKLMAKEKNLNLTVGYKEKILSLDTKDPHFANAREIRNLLEKTMKRQAVRVIENELQGEDLNIILPEDFPKNKESKSRIGFA